MDLTGRKLGKYEILERLGQGGMAAVYKAFQPGVERHVALKIMHSHLADSADFIARFRREAQSIGRLQHPHIARVIDFDVEAGLYYMVMDFIQGGTLQDYLKQQTPLAVAEAIRITLQLTDALAYAHAQNMVHRDIKPGNVMFMDAARTHVVLTDFGIAHLLDHQFTQLTMAGAAVGTPTYMSPEAALGEAPDGRADIYSLGVMLFEMVAGRAPYVAETPFSLMTKQANEPIPSPHAFNPHLPLAIEPILAKALAKAPADRYQSAQEFGDALRAMAAELRNDPVHSRAPFGRPPAVVTVQKSPKARQEVDPTIRKRNRGLLLAAGGVLLVAILTTTVLLSVGQPPTAAPIDQSAAAAATAPATEEDAARQPTAGPTEAPTETTRSESPQTPATALAATVGLTDTVALTTTIISTSTGTPTNREAVAGPIIISSTEGISTTVIATAPLEIATTAAISVAEFPRPLGSLQFMRDGAGSTNFRLYLSQIDQPPPANQYALWLVGDGDSALHLASFTPEQHHLLLEARLDSTTTSTQLLTYHTALIGVEAVANRAVGIPETILYSSTLPADQLRSPLTALLATNALDTDNLGLLTAAQTQLAIAITHGGFLQDALAAADLVETHRHAEHLVNILDGESGTYYGDLDRNGTVQNPGNGVGVLVYFKEARAQLEPLALVDPSNRYVTAGLETLRQIYAVAEVAKEKAAQIIAADSTAEAQPQANELVALLAAIARGEDRSRDGTVDPLQGEGGLAALTPLTERLLTYHFVDKEQLVAATPSALGTLHFYKDVAAAAIADDTSPTSGAGDGTGYGGSGYGSEGDRSTQNNAPLFSDAFYLLVEGLLAAPANHHYELWLTNTATDQTLALGPLTLSMGRVDLTGTVDKNAFIHYNQASIVAVADDEATDDATHPIYVAKRTPILDEILQTLVVRNDETRSGLAWGAAQQLALAVLHTGFLQDELKNNDLTAARRHAEHVLNIVVGEEGPFFGDSDGDGMPQNPGDGVGVLTYLAQIESRLTALLAEEQLHGATRPAAQDMLSIITKNRALIEQAEETTLRVFAADTTAEVQFFEDEIKHLLNDALRGVDLDSNGGIDQTIAESGIDALANLVVEMGAFVFVEDEAP